MNNEKNYLSLFRHSISILRSNENECRPKTSKIKYDVLGNVTALSGDVFKSKVNDSSSIRLGLKFGIKKGDIITTGKDSYVKIQLLDNTVISLGPESHFSFRNYEFESITDRSANFDLLKGKCG